MSQQMWKPSSTVEENPVLLIGPSPQTTSQLLPDLWRQHKATPTASVPQANSKHVHHHHHRWSGYTRREIMENKTRKNALSTRSKQRSAVFTCLGSLLGLTQTLLFQRRQDIQTLRSVPDSWVMWTTVTFNLHGPLTPPSSEIRRAPLGSAQNPLQIWEQCRSRVHPGALRPLRFFSLIKLFPSLRCEHEGARDLITNSTKYRSELCTKHLQNYVKILR